MAAAIVDAADPGYRHVPQIFDPDEIAALSSILSAVPSSSAGRRWAGDGLAQLLGMPAMQAVRGKLKGLLPEMAILRAVAFRKDANANWFVPAHQDRSIPIPSAELPPGFSRATRKGDGWQAEAPAAVLGAMRNVRIFIDAATADDGPLEVIPGTHRLGRIPQSAIPTLADKTRWHALTGNAGDIVVLSPLLLHRSRRAVEPKGRRVLQIECIPHSLIRGGY
jgi:hypothetical protein